MYIGILDRKRIDCLRELTAVPELKGFYLAGGTALSLQLGLRESVDFYFFTQRKFNSDSVCAAIGERFENTSVIQMDADTCNMFVDDVQVGLMFYPYPLVGEPVMGNGELETLTMAGIDDIAVMKLSAIGARGARKDFL